MSAWSGCWWVMRIASSPVMPSKPCEKFPGSNSTVVEVDSPTNSARRHECPKCVNCMPILCAQGWWAMRLMLAVVLAAWGLAVGAADPASALPRDCPPNCDRIPDSAWIDSAALPLYPVYRWPGLAAVAVTATNPRFRFEEACGAPVVPDDPRGFAVAARAVVPQPEGQWQLQVQVIHWRGETWRGGQLASSVFDKAVAALRGCQLTAPPASPSVTTDAPNRMAAVITGVLPEQAV